MRVWFSTMALVVIAACSSGSGDGDDDGTNRDAGFAPGAACGIKGTPEGTECTSYRDCRGADNFGVRSDCANCPTEAYFETCASGKCDLYDRSGFMNFGFTVNDTSVGANAYVAMVVDPMAADGTQVTCAALMSTCTLRDNRTLNVTNVDLGEPPGGLQRDQSYTRSMTAHVGANRIGYLVVTSQSNGNGDIVAHGCTENVNVTSGATTDVLINLEAY